MSWTLTTASIGPELGVYAADQSELTPSSEMYSSRSWCGIVFLRNSSTCATFSSVFSIRVPLAARTYISKAPASTSG